jgi:TolB-like protein/Flp pilus assembly protein TadD
MPSESPSDLKFEIGHVLFIDIVGYSKLLINEQSEQIQKLRETVRGTDQFRVAEAEGKLLRLPTGDGGALVFRTTPEAPVLCAMEIARALKSHPELRVRMGIHSGPVNEISDLNEQANIAGAGINFAQRVMDCGDAGHILLSRHVAEDLQHYPRWQSSLHDLGECEVKHGVHIGLTNLYRDGIGNPQIPKKLQVLKRHRARSRWIAVAAALVLLAGVVAAFVIVSRRPARSIANIPEKSIAVLPFENLSDDKQNAFFTDGVQDEILTDLARVADLKVISRTSVMQYKDTSSRDLREIGEKLGVAHLLEGSVQRVANKVRVNAQLIDARNDAHLWAQTYDRDLADVFAIQSEIAEAIAQQLQAHLSSTEKAQIAKTPTTDLVAYDLFLRARQLLDLANNPDAKGSLLQAITLLEEAVRRDPKFVRAHCLMCEIHLELYWEGFDHTDTRRELARVALQNAESLQPDSGEVHLQKGLYAYHGFRDYDRALSEFELARQLLPNESALYVLLGSVDRRTARWKEAEEAFRRAVELDPNSFGVLEEAGFTFQRLRRYREAEPLLKRALTISPNDPFARGGLGWNAFCEKGDVAAWRKELESVANNGPEAARGVAFLSLLCAWTEHDRAGAEKAIALVPPEGIANTIDETPIPREWCVGRTARIFGDTEIAQASLGAARTIFEHMTRDQPDYAQAWAYLGLTDAMLGRRDDAIREGNRACELLPYSRDSWVGPQLINNLAMIYAWVADKESALKQLEVSVNIPTGISYGELKLNPDWDPLRGDPRFEALVQKIVGPKQIRLNASF